MSIGKPVRKYLEAIGSEVFARYEKQFAERISSALSKGYLQKLREPALVQIVEDVVNSVGNLTMKDRRPYFELSTRAIFIHGNKSQVEFDYYGQVKKRELGDLIFIISVVFNGQKHFEKFTVNQFKRDRIRLRDVSWDLSNRPQLYLLSRFPAFKGIGGSIVPMREYALPNYSRCLGSYGLLYKPGDFAFVSATELDSFIGEKNSLKMRELYHLAHQTETYRFPFLPYFHPDIDELALFMDTYYRRHELEWFLPWNVCGNYHHAHDAFDFAHKYLRVGIGEPTFAEMGISNSQARRFLHELLLAVRHKGKRGDIGRLVSFVDGYFKYGYAGDEGEGGLGEGMESDFEGGGIGIVHTIINLGE